MRHPLLNDSSSHYEAKGEPSIFRLERESSVQASMGWAENNVKKYQERLGEKSHISGMIKEVLDAYFINRPEQYEQFIKDHKEEVRQSDLKKIATYKAYSDVLIPLLHKGYKYQTVSHALELEGIVYEYQ